MKLNLIWRICILYSLFLFPIYSGFADKTGEITMDNVEKFVSTYPDSVIYFGNRYLSESNSKILPENRIRVIELIVNALMKKGEFDLALKTIKNADTIMETGETNPELLVELEITKGLIYLNSGFLDISLEYFTSGENLIQKTQNNVLYAKLYYYLGLANYELQKYSDCRKYAKLSIHYYNMEKCEDEIVNSLTLIANSHSNADSIIYYLQQASNTALIAENQYKKATISNNLGLVYKSIGEYYLSKQEYVNALNISKQNGFQEIQVYTLNNYAYLLMNMGLFDSANISLSEAQNINKKLKSKEVEATLLDSYSDYYINTKDTVRAYLTFKESVKLKNELAEQKQIDKTKLLLTAFETEQKEQQIAVQNNMINQSKVYLLAISLIATFLFALLIILRQRLIQRKAKIIAIEKEKRLEVVNALIEGQDEERNRLAMDLHDSISPKLGIMKMKIANNISVNQIDNDTMEYLDDIHDELRDITHRLTPPSLLKSGLVLALKNLVANLSKNTQIKFHLFSNIDDRIDKKYEKNLYYISYELINNAIKHANPNEISIQLVRDRETITLSIEDDGKGFNLHNFIPGLGINNIRQRVDYLDGDLSIESKTNQGTQIITVFEYE